MASAVAFSVFFIIPHKDSHERRLPELLWKGNREKRRGKRAEDREVTRIRCVLYRYQFPISNIIIVYHKHVIVSIFKTAKKVAKTMAYICSN